MSRGPWIQTFTGRQFFLLDPRPEEVDPVDIAHALAHLCRFTGHTRVHYSVAEHSVRALRMVPDDAPRGLALAVLLHDAAEAYVGDVSSPLKACLPDYKAIEARVSAAIGARFGLDPAAFGQEIHRLDLVMLATERRDLLGASAARWDDLPAPAAERIVPWEAPRAKEELLGALRRLAPHVG